MNLLADESLPTHVKGRTEKLVVDELQKVKTHDGVGLGKVIPSVDLSGMTIYNSMKEPTKKDDGI